MTYSKVLASTLTSFVLCGTIACGDDASGSSNSTGGAGPGLSGAGTSATGGSQTTEAARGGRSNLGQSSIGGTGNVGGGNGGATQSATSSVSGVNCNNATLTCKMMSPTCNTGEVPVINAEGSCYTQECAPIGECSCRSASDCPVSATDEWACIVSTGRCSYYL